MNNGDPIIGCSRSNGRCVIHGLFWCKGKMGSYDEYSIAIYQHTENIRKAVKTAIKYDAELSAI
uniref:Uncharacterized protein n=1 Tax=Romanomermis culicivorax TaxID=13658 RepID=A0A915L1L7_ROMCU